jgi:hypothetical protein
MAVQWLQNVFIFLVRMAVPRKTLREHDGYVMTANPAPASFDGEGGFAEGKKPDPDSSKN